MSGSLVQQKAEHHPLPGPGFPPALLFLTPCLGWAILPSAVWVPMAMHSVFCWLHGLVRHTDKIRISSWPLRARLLTAACPCCLPSVGHLCPHLPLAINATHSRLYLISASSSILVSPWSAQGCPGSHSPLQNPLIILPSSTPTCPRSRCFEHDPLTCCWPESSDHPGLTKVVPAWSLWAHTEDGGILGWIKNKVTVILGK